MFALLPWLPYNGHNSNIGKGTKMANWPNHKKSTDPTCQTKKQAVWTKEMRRAAAERLRQRNLTNNPMCNPEIIKKRTGWTMSEEQKAKISDTKKKQNRKQPPKEKAKQIAAQIGRIKSPEERANISAALKGRKAPWVTKRNLENNPMNSPEARAKISGENSPTKRPEVRAKMRAAGIRITSDPNYIPITHRPGVYVQGYKQPVCLMERIHRDCRTQHFERNIKCPNCLRGEYPQHNELGTDHIEQKEK